MVVPTEVNNASKHRKQFGFFSKVSQVLIKKCNDLFLFPIVHTFQKTKVNEKKMKKKITTKMMKNWIKIKRIEIKIYKINVKSTNNSIIAWKVQLIHIMLMELCSCCCIVHWNVFWIAYNRFDYRLTVHVSLPQCSAFNWSYSNYACGCSSACDRAYYSD